ncbi:MAG TPA: 30S ribosomal protein S6 [Gaiellales bacterium]|nr:30S ribosomal protein S6 [Gaiellales bacterium]
MIRINPYEIMLMIEPEVAEERQREITDRIKATVTERGGTWGEVDAWGKRKLAYEIEHHADAWYYVLTFDAPAEALAEVTRVLAITEGVMRHMAVNRLKAAPARPAEPAAEPAEAPA